MATVNVSRVFPVPIAEVFACMTDAGNYPQVPGIFRSQRVLAAAGPDADGVGAQRIFDLGLVKFREEVVVYDKPNVMEYLIREIRPAVRHEHGRISFREVPGGTEVCWASTFTVPVSGWLHGPADRVLARAVSASFAAALALQSRRLQRSLARRTHALNAINKGDNP
jgi:hypothetical protein